MTREQEFLKAAITGDQLTFLSILDDKSIRINPNHTDDRGNTALIFAASICDGYIVRALLAHPSVDPNKSSVLGNTALIWAAGNGHGDIVSVLLADERVQPNEVNTYGYTALVDASYYGHPEVILKLLANARINLTYADQAQKALSKAASRQYVQTLSTLLLYSGHRLTADSMAKLSSSAQNFYTRTYAGVKKILRARLLGLIRAVIVFKRRRLHAALAVYAPGGAGFAVAAARFNAVAASFDTTQTDGSRTSMRSKTDNAMDDVAPIIKLTSGSPTKKHRT